MGISLAEVFQNGDLLAEAMIKAWRDFGHAMILLENGTTCNSQACGVKVIYRNRFERNRRQGLDLRPG